MSERALTMKFCLFLPPVIPCPTLQTGPSQSRHDRDGAHRNRKRAGCHTVDIPEPTIPAHKCFHMLSPDTGGVDIEAKAGIFQFRKQ